MSAKPEESTRPVHQGHLSTTVLYSDLWRLSVEKKKNTHKHMHTHTHKLQHTLTHTLTHSLTHTLTHSLTHTDTHTHPNPPSLSARRILAVSWCQCTPINCSNCED